MDWQTREPLAFGEGLGALLVPRETNKKDVGSFPHC